MNCLTRSEIVNNRVFIRPRADMFNVHQFKSAARTKPFLLQELILAVDTAFRAHCFQYAYDITSKFAKITSALVQ